MGGVGRAGRRGGWRWAGRAELKRRAQEQGAGERGPFPTPKTNTWSQSYLFRSSPTLCTKARPNPVHSKVQAHRHSLSPPPVPHPARAEFLHLLGSSTGHSPPIPLSHLLAPRS